MPIKEELFIDVEKSFTQHISLGTNFRILFSGKFGTGKTTFLNYYFEKHKQFNAIHLYPVNYSILENEDIFSYLKYDILLELFSNHEYPLNPDYYKFLEGWDDFLLDNLSQVIATTMLLIPKMGRQLNQFVKELTQLKSEFSKIQRSKEEREKDEISQYLLQFHQNEGGIYETNVITLIIQEWLKDISNGGKKNVLVIDDLDRIDPNHIFRLLNIFSAHFDSRDRDPAKNKFGFDQVIVVCDIDNIENIYRQQFGIQTDFNGYVDKFYSLEIFRFDNKSNLISIVDNIISSIQIKFREGDDVHRHQNEKRIKETVSIILKPLILNNEINLRSIFKFADNEFTIPDLGISINDQSLDYCNNFYLSAISVLTSIVGDFKILKNKIEKLKTFPITKDEHPQLLIGDIVLLNGLDDLPKLYHLNGSNASLKYETEIDSKIYKGQVQVYGQTRDSIVYSGLLGTMIINDDEIDISGRSDNIINFLPFLKESLTIIEQQTIANK